MALTTYIIIGLLLRQECASQILEWLGWREKPQFIGFGTPLLDIPFEELGPEDKFLVEASKITGLKLSQLDVCQHKIVMKIKSSCGSLSDEEIAKLSVNLLNCQADVEGRKTYPCTEEMPLKACTSEMDADTWNAYHIMSNRARAVCYAARQEEFRALAEMTINKLVATARTHVEQMSAMQEKHAKLEKATELALDKISRSQHEVLMSYSRLRRLESGLGNKLVEDKSDLEAIGTLVGKEVESIEKILKEFKETIGYSGQELISQKKVEAVEHEKIMNILKESLELIDDLLKKIGKMSLLLDKHNEQYLKQSDSLKEDLKAVGKSLSEVAANAGALQQFADDKMSVVNTLIGENGERLDTTLCASLHLLCLLVAMVISSFLDFPRRLRALVVIAAGANAYTSIANLYYSFHLTHLYLSLLAAVIIDTSIVQIRRLMQNGKEVSPDFRGRLDRIRLSPQENDFNRSRKPHSKVDEWLSEKFGDRDSGVKNGVISSMTPVFKNAVLSRNHDEVSLASGRSTRSRLRNVTPPRSVAGSSTSGRKTSCSVLKANGQKCRMPPRPGQDTCRIHESSR